MKHKLGEILGILLIAFAFGVFLWIRPELGFLFHPAGEGQEGTPTQGSEANAEDVRQIKNTITRAVRIDIEAAYTFDTSQLATVYTNDPRGGEITSLDLAVIQDIRQDPSLRIDQVGELDSKQANIERLKRIYDKYIADLRTKVANNNPLSAEEKIIFEGETNGWPTPTPDMAGSSPAPTLPCQHLYPPSATPIMSYPAPNPNLPPTPYPGPTQLPEPRSYPPPPTPPPATAYPPPNGLPVSTANPFGSSFIHPTDYPHTNPVALPTSVEGMADSSQSAGCPTPFPNYSSTLFIRADGRGINPALLPPESFEVDIQSITIEGEVARAVVVKPGLSYEQVLVKVIGEWYLGGAKILSCCG